MPCTCKPGPFRVKATCGYIVWACSRLGRFVSTAEAAYLAAGLVADLYMWGSPTGLTQRTRPHLHVRANRWECVHRVCWLLAQWVTLGIRVTQKKASAVALGSSRMDAADIYIADIYITTNPPIRPKLAKGRRDWMCGLVADKSDKSLASSQKR